MFMTLDELKSAHQAQPFRSFAIRTEDGREIPVRRPEYLSYSATGVTVAVFGHQDESYSIFGISDIAELKFGGGRSNGRTKNPRKR